jgi:hypothetical protein
MSPGRSAECSLRWRGGMNAYIYIPNCPWIQASRAPAAMPVPVPEIASSIEAANTW